MRNKGRNQSIVKEINRTLIIEEVVAAGEISRSELAKKLNLSNPSVSKHVDALISKGILIETGAKKTVVGRRPIILQFNADYGCVAVIDLSKKEARICVSDLLGSKIETAHIEGGESISPELIGRAEAALHELLLKNGDKYGKLLGITVIVAGTVSSVTGEIRIEANVQPLRSTDICSLYSRSFDAHVFVKNAANLAVVGERFHGAGIGETSILYLGIDQALGLGVVSDGRIFEGMSGTACDISSVLLFNDPGKRPRTLAQIYGMESLVNMAKELFETAPDCVLNEWTVPENLSGEDIIRACSVGDKAVLSVVKRFAAITATACHDLSCLFDTNLIIIGGMASRLSDQFLDEVKACYALLPGCNNREIKLAKSTDNTIFGGIDLLVHEVLRIDLSND